MPGSTTTVRIPVPTLNLQQQMEQVPDMIPGNFTKQLAGATDATDAATAPFSYTPLLLAGLAVLVSLIIIWIIVK